MRRLAHQLIGTTRHTDDGLIVEQVLELRDHVQRRVLHIVIGDRIMNISLMLGHTRATGRIERKAGAVERDAQIAISIDVDNTTNSAEN